MEQDQVFIRMSPSETLLNRTMQVIVDMIKNKPISNIDLEQLRKLPKNLVKSLLRILSKRGYLNDENIYAFLHAEQTRVLELSECNKITDLALEKISTCKNLAKLDLNSNSVPRTEVTSEGISNLLKSCNSLQHVLLRRCVLIDDACVNTLAVSCLKLTSLNIGNCPLITDKSLISLGKNCKYLKSINLTGTKITDNGIFQLISDSVSKTIEEIHIAHCDLITDESIECILLNSKKIKYLMFHSCPKITDQSRIALEDYMTNSSNQKIKHLTWTIY